MRMEVGEGCLQSLLPAPIAVAAEDFRAQVGFRHSRIPSQPSMTFVCHTSLPRVVGVQGATDFASHSLTRSLTSRMYEPLIERLLAPVVSVSRECVRSPRARLPFSGHFPNHERVERRKRRRTTSQPRFERRRRPTKKKICLRL